MAELKNHKEIDVLSIRIGSFRGRVEVGNLNSRLEIAIQKAVIYLLNKQGSNGSWSDFSTLAGESTEWVTAYVAISLKGRDNLPGKNAIEKATNWLLKSPFYRAGWGYNRKVPVDADSTAWVLRLLDENGRGNHWKARIARRFLLSCQSEDGGIRTYGNDFRIRMYTRVNRGISMKGWCNAHSCVTANAACSEGRHKERAISFIKENQNLDGSWSAYWWRDRAYAVALALNCVESNANASEKGDALNWCVNEVKETDKAKEKGAFYVACLCDILLHDYYSNLVEIINLMDWLLSKQLHDGSWDASAALRIPPTFVTNPDSYERWIVGGKGGGSIIFDQHRNYTTATVLKCLSRFQKAMIDGSDVEVNTHS